MRAAGIDVRPIVEMTGGHHFNEVFLTDVRVPRGHRIGEEGDGWRLATLTLASERDALSEGGVIWGMGPTSDDLFDLLRKDGVHDAVLRQDVARVYSEKVVLELLAQSAAPSVRKCLADVHGQHVMSLMLATRGTFGLLGASDPDAKERRRVALGLPVQPGPDHRRRHEPRCNATSSASACSGCRDDQAFDTPRPDGETCSW